MIISNQMDIMLDEEGDHDMMFDLVRVMLILTDGNCPRFENEGYTVEKKSPECFGRSHGCEWVNLEPRCPQVEACKVKDEALNGKRDCSNCIVLDFNEHMDGFDPSVPGFIILRRFLEDMVKDWCDDCKAYGYGKWQRRGPGWGFE
jgi:hypothetical protein